MAVTEPSLEDRLASAERERDQQARYYQYEMDRAERLVGELAQAQVERDRLTAERDSLRVQVDQVIAQRDALKAKLAWAEGELSKIWTALAGAD